MIEKHCDFCGKIIGEKEPHALLMVTPENAQSFITLDCWKICERCMINIRSVKVFD